MTRALALHLFVFVGSAGAMQINQTVEISSCEEAFELAMGRALTEARRRAEETCSRFNGTLKRIDLRDIEFRYSSNEKHCFGPRVNIRYVCEMPDR